jgi:predicted nucleotide-binding protein
MQKPRVFIGSSSEGLAVAQAVVTLLARHTESTLWTDLFTPGTYPLEALDDAIRRHAFAVLIASPDDQVVKRGVANRSMRDNVMLEFGLFVGAFGRRRVFFVSPDQPQLEFPSDLSGLTVTTYDVARIAGTKTERINALRPACMQLRSAIRRECEIAEALQRKQQLALAASIQMQAIRRLSAVATQLGEAVMSIQLKSVASLANRAAFETVKAAVAREVAHLADGFLDDADVAGVRAELEELRDAAIDAIVKIPFPKELLIRKTTARKKAMKMGRDAFHAITQFRDPIKEVREAAAAEIRGRLAAVSQRYETWRADHSPRLFAAGVRFQRALHDHLLRFASVQLQNQSAGWPGSFMNSTP